MELRGGGAAAVDSGDPRAVRIMAGPCLCAHAGLCPDFVSESQNHPPREKLQSSDQLTHFRDGQSEAETWGGSCPRSRG